MAAKRLLALDVFRGATMMLMILVNTPGSWGHIYPPFRHAPWHGLTLTDLVFPFFLYIIGVAMWFSMKKYSASATMKKVVIRALKIFLLGTFLRAMPFLDVDWSHFRIMGVLQRIAVAYLIAAFMVMKLSPKQLLVSSMVILLGYWGLLYGLGGDEPYAIATNVVRRFDLAVFGADHLWHGHDMAFDPEGLLSSFPAVVTVILGYFSARVIQSESTLNLSIQKLLIYGSMGIVIGRLWGFVFPINKALWTSSYVLVTAGIGAIVLAILLWIIDERGLRKWTFPFVVFGKNAILGFVLSNVIVKIMLKTKWVDVQGEEWNGYAHIYEKIFVPAFGQLNGSLGFAISTVLAVGIILLLFHWKKWFLKL